MRIGKWLCAAGCAMVITAAGFFLAPSSSGEDEQTLRGVQAVRVSTMKSINRAMRRIKVHAGKENYKRVASAANEVALLSVAIPYLSPRGSNLKPTRIRDEVWSRFADYRKIAFGSAEIARRLAAAAEAGEGARVMREFTALSDSCGQCHKPYRKKKGEK